MKKWIFLTLFISGAAMATYGEDEVKKEQDPEKKKERMEARKEKLRAEGRTEEEIAEIMKKKEEGHGERPQGPGRPGGLSEEDKKKIIEKLKADGKTDAQIEEIMKKNAERVGENNGRPRGPISEEDKKKFLENQAKRWKEKLLADGKTEEEADKIVKERLARVAEEAKVREEWPNMTPEQKKEVIEKWKENWKKEGVADEEIEKRIERRKEMLSGKREERKENREERKERKEHKEKKD